MYAVRKNPTPEKQPSRAGSLPQLELGIFCQRLVGSQAAIAGKPAPTRICANPRFRDQHQILVGAELAREEAGTFKADAECADAFASRLAPTGFVFRPILCAVAGQR
jgi:hypothetical protein